MVLARVARSRREAGLLPICILCLGNFLKDLSMDHVYGDLGAVATGRLQG